MDDVGEAILRSDFEVALVYAIAAWRDTKHAVHADLVDAIAAKCKPAPLAGRSKDAFQKAWLELARRAATSDDPCAIAALANGLLKSVPVREIRYLAPERDVKRQRPFLERIEAFGKCAADPRVAQALCGVLVKAPFSVDDVGGVYGPVIDLVIRLRDERSAARLRALVASPLAKTATVRDYFARALPDAADAIDRGLRRRRPLAEEERAAAERLLAQLGAKPAPLVVSNRRAVDTDTLLADCLAHPDDDGPREVLADALLEREDPRGDFIHLQLRDARGELDEGARTRMAQLLRKHEKEWIGDLARVTKNRVYRRGFVDEAQLLQGAAADQATWKRVAVAPVIATIRTLHKESASEELYKTFVLGPAMPLLRDIDVPSAAMLRAIARPIEHIKLHAGLTKDALACMDDVARTTGVERLTFEVKQPPEDVFATLEAWPARKHFIELSVMLYHRVAEAWFAELAGWLLAFDRLGVRRLGLARRHDRLVVERGKRGLLVEIDASNTWLLGVVAGAKLGAIERVVVRGTPEPWSKPGAPFANLVKRLRTGKALVELREGWQPFAS